jgi:hypothetical protein
VGAKLQLHRQCVGVHRYNLGVRFPFAFLEQVHRQRVGVHAGPVRQAPAAGVQAPAHPDPQNAALPTLARHPPDRPRREPPLDPSPVPPLPHCFLSACVNAIWRALCSAYAPVACLLASTLLHVHACGAWWWASPLSCTHVGCARGQIASVRCLRHMVVGVGFSLHARGLC